MQLTLALAKGRLADMSIELLQRSGVDCSVLMEPSRKLVFEDASGNYRFILVKPGDVPAYVHYGVADVGIAGKDTLLEEGFPLYEMLDLGFGRCRMCVCGFPEKRERSITAANLRVATKYVNVARDYYLSKGETVEIIKLNGSIEIAPILGLADVIMDIVESGRTLKENGLDVLEEVVSGISARVVVNRVSLKTKGREIKALIGNMRASLQDGGVTK